jgi:autotransporter-associated beta strand protein
MSRFAQRSPRQNENNAATCQPTVMKTRIQYKNQSRRLMLGAVLAGTVLAGSAQAAVWSFTNKNDTAWTTAANWNPNTVPPLGTNNYPGRFNVGAASPAHATNVTLIYDSPLTTGFGTIVNASPEFGRGLSVANGSGTFGTLRVVSGALNIYQAALIDAAIVCAPANSTSTSRGHLLLDGGNLTVIATNYGVLSFPFRGSSNALGMVTVQNGSTLKVDRLRFGGTGAYNDIGVDLPGVLNLNAGGTVHMRNIGNYLRPENLRATNNFNGGKIQVLAAETFSEGKNPLIGSNIVNNLLEGGLVVDTAGFDARIVSPLFNGVAGRDGGIVKLGAGTLKLAGFGSTFTGPSIVSNGTLSVQVPMTCTDIRVLSGQGLNFMPDSVAPWSLPSLGLTNASLGFDYGIFAGYTDAVVSVAALDLQGTILVNLIGNNFPITTLTLLTYGSKTGGGSFALGSLPSGAAATLTDTGHSLELRITSASLQSLTWAGGDGIWKTNGAANWNGGAAVYLEYGASGDIVIFDDTVGGTVNIPAIVKPASITVDDSFASYVFSGAGGISGPTGLDKQGASTLQVDTSNSFAGEVAINGGTLLVNHPNALGATNGGTTVYGPASTLLLGVPGGAGVTVSDEMLNISGPGVGGSLGALRGAASASGLNVWAGAVIIGDSAARIGTEDGGNLTLAGSISDRGFNFPLTIRPGSASTMVFTGASNSWGGTTTIFGSDNSSVVVLGANNVLPANSLLAVGGNATVELNGFNHTVAGLAWATGGNTMAPVINNSGALSTLSLNPAANQSFPGDITGAISIVKMGPAVQSLTGANLSYTGMTMVNGGELNLATVGTMAAAVTVADGATLSGEAATTGSLTLQANSALSVDPVTPGSFVAGTVNASASPVLVRFTGSLAANTPVLVLSAPRGITGSAANFQAVGVRGGVFYLSNSNTELMFSPSAVSTTLTWKGSDPANPTFWDTTTTNWGNSGKADHFFIGDNVVFDDSAASFLVAVQAGGVSPGGVRFANAAKAYTLSGGAISGQVGLTKTGLGSVTLASANSYTGETLIQEGTLVLQNGAALGSVDGGTTVTNGGTLDVGGMNLGAEVITIAGAGVGGNGAIVNDSGVDQINALQQVVLAGHATVGGNARWDLRGADNTLDMGGFTLTKTGTNQVALVGTAVNNPGNIMVDQGIFSLHLATALNGSSANTITIQSGAALNFYQSPIPQEWSLVLNGGSTYWSSVGGIGQNDWNGPVSVQGEVTLRADSPCQFFGSVTGQGSIIKTGVATATLAGSSSYAGNTTVSQGTLVLSQAALAPGATISVAANALLQLDLPITNSVAALRLNGVSKAPGLYNSTTDPGYLAGAGSLLVTATAQPTLGYTRSGNSLQFVWDGSFKLQAQTNTIQVGISTNWSDYPGGGSSPVTVPLDAANGSVLFRLSTP